MEEAISALTNKMEEYSSMVNEYFMFVQSIPEESLSLENPTVLTNKSFVISGLIEQLKQQGPNDFPSSSEEICADIEIGLMEDIKNKKILLLKNEKECAEATAELESLKKQIDQLSSIAVNRQHKGEMKKDDRTKVSQELDLAFQRHKRKLHGVIAELFPKNEEELKDLLAELCSAYFKGAGEGYICVDDFEKYEVVEFLLNAHIIKRHPYEKSMIKLHV